MKVLLFVQTGGARPKCVSRSAGFDPAERLQGQQWLGDSGLYVWWTAHATALAADRWWLVAAANAEDGRFVIECDREAGGVLRDHFASDGKRIYGRVLASGGRP